MVRKYLFNSGPFDNGTFRDRSAVNNGQPVGIAFLPADSRDFQRWRAGECFRQRGCDGFFRVPGFDLLRGGRKSYGRLLRNV